MTGRTSIAPERAPGTRPAILVASSISGGQMKALEELMRAFD